MDTDDIVFLVEMSKESLLKALSTSPFNDRAVAVEVNGQEDGSFMSQKRRQIPFIVIGWTPLIKGSGCKDIIFKLSI